MRTGYIERKYRWIARPHLLPSHHNHNLDLDVVMTFASKSLALQLLLLRLPNIRLQVLENERSCKQHAPINLTFTLSYFGLIGERQSSYTPIW